MATGGILLSLRPSTHPFASRPLALLLAATVTVLGCRAREAPSPDASAPTNGAPPAASSAPAETAEARQPAPPTPRREPPPGPVATVAAPATPAAPLAPCTPPEVLQLGPTTAPAEATIVVLHGFGTTAADMERVARALMSASSRLAVLIPDGCDAADGHPRGRQWWSRARSADRSAAMSYAGARVSRLVKAELERRRLPRDRVAWAGFSQGAMLAQWMAVHGSPTPVAAISFSGRLDDDSPVGPPVGTPVLLVHGARDTMVPFAEAARSEATLTLRGAKVERLDRPTMGHAIDDDSLRAAIAFLTRTLRAP